MSSQTGRTGPVSIGVIGMQPDTQPVEPTVRGVLAQKASIRHPFSVAATRITRSWERAGEPGYSITVCRKRLWHATHIVTIPP